MLGNADAESNTVRTIPEIFKNANLLDPDAVSETSSLVVTEPPVANIFSWNLWSLHLAGPHVHFFTGSNTADFEALIFVDHEFVTSDKNKLCFGRPRARSVIPHAP